MTYPTIEEIGRIKDADRYTEAALEFVWAFTDWWEGTAEDGNGKMSVDSELGMNMERAYERWLHLR